ncbi:MAG TPA: hypothetical protein VGA51_14480 [Casimicrobiaceae bacterium]
MIDPFIPDNLKPASYEIPFSGTVYWWDVSSKTRQQLDIKNDGDVFNLESNSIAFVNLDTNFFLPDYIAVRFNLRITHVHQGLLLGTGPLVDPGFCGRLLVPLHNLTANKYTLIKGHGFIWVEFTKLSDNVRWAAIPGQQRRGKYVPFRPDKKFIVAETYFAKANQGQRIVSSIPEAIRESQEGAETAAKSAHEAEKHAAEGKKDAAEAKKSVDRSIWISVLSILAGVFIGGFALIQIFQNTMDSKTNATQEVSKASIEALRKDIEALRLELAKTRPDPTRIDVMVTQQPGTSAVQKSAPKQ